MEAKQLSQFIAAIESDPGHAAYLLGLRHNAALQYHAVNVGIVGSMTEAAYLEDAPKLYPREFAEVQRVADQCAQLAEALGKDVNTLQSIDLFMAVLTDMKEAQQPKPVEEVKPVEEAKPEDKAA